MKTEKVQAVSSSNNDLLKDEGHLNAKITLNSLKSRLNEKIHDLALPKIARSPLGVICGHLIEVLPEVFFHVFPRPFNLKKIEKKKDYLAHRLVREKEDEKCSGFDHFSEEKKVPIGIQPNYIFFWINALLQFIIFIPSLKQLLYYIPKSFSCFIDFIDKYQLDRKQNKKFTEAKADLLVESLIKRYSKMINMHAAVDLSFLIREMKKLSMDRPGNDQKEGNCFSFISVNNEDIVFEDFLEKVLQSEKQIKRALPMEFFVTFKWFLEKSKIINTKCYPSVLFFFSDKTTSALYYELDAFIEYRPDEYTSAGYITYVKVDGLWYQCDDLKIRKIRSNSLHIALHRAFLFHYKKVKIKNSNNQLV